MFKTKSKPTRIPETIRSGELYRKKAVDRANLFFNSTNILTRNTQILAQMMLMLISDKMRTALWTYDSML